MRISANRWCGVALGFALLGTAAANDADGQAWPLDCNDGNGDVFDGAPETCDGFDNDCDGAVDTGCLRTCPALQPGAPVSIGAAIGASTSPRITHTSAGFDAAWVDERDGNPEIYLGEFDRFGVSLGDESRLSTHPAASYDPAIASPGDYRAVFWVDERTGRPEVFFTRCCTGFGDAFQRQLTTNASADGIDPDATWGGFRWAIVYAEGSGSAFEVFAHLLEDTSIVDPAARAQVSSGGGLARRPAVAFSGSGYGVVWQDDRHGDTEIYFRALDEALVPTSGEIRLTNAGGDSTRPAIVWSEDRFAVVWEDTRDGNPEIYAAMLDQAGNPLSPVSRITNDLADSNTPRIAATGAEFLVSWVDTRSGLPEVLGARLGPDAGVLEGPLTIDGPAASLGSPDIAWIGDAPIVAYEDAGSGEIRAVRNRCCGDLDGDGFDRCVDDCDDGRASINPLAVDACNGFDDDCDGFTDLPCQRVCGGPDRNAAPLAHHVDGTFSVVDGALAWDGGSIGAVWEQSPVNSSPSEFVFQRLDADGNETGPAQVFTGGSGEIFRSPTIAASPDGFTVAHAGLDNAVPSVHVRRFDAAGNPVGTPLSWASGGESVDYLQLVWHGRGYGLVYTVYEGIESEVFFRRLSPAGVPFGPATSLGLDTDSGTIAWSGSEFVIVYRRGSLSVIGLFRRRFDVDGREIGSELQLTADSGERYPFMLWRDSGYGIIFGRFSQTYFMRLDANGNTAGEEQSLYNSPFDLITYPTLGWNGQEHYALWTNFQQERLFARRLDAGGNPIAPTFEVANGSTGPLRGSRLGMIWNGDTFVAGWGQDDSFLTQVFGCCPGGDPDGDRSCLQDCDETDPLRYPGAPERCNQLDDDCDGSSAGEGPFAVVENLRFDDGQNLSWDAQGAGILYDTQRGDLTTLRSSGGDFTSATDTCLASNSPDAFAGDPSQPAIGAGLVYYTAAGSGFCQGTFESGGAAQSGLRDEEIAASSEACP